MPVRIRQTVVAVACLAVACSRPAGQRPGGAGSASAAAGTPEAHGSVGATPAPPSPLAGSGVRRLDTGGAYVGCGKPIPRERLWEETSEGQVAAAIGEATACAAKNGRRLLLEFVAPWCEDCQEMARLERTDVVTAALESRFERVRINVGKWDRHEALRLEHGVRALATYVVVDPESSKELAQTTLEPITKKGQKLSPEAWAGWLRQH